MVGVLLMKNLRTEKKTNDEASKKASSAVTPTPTPTPAPIIPEPSAGKEDVAENKKDEVSPVPKKKKNPAEEKEQDFSTGKDDHPQKNDLEKYSHNLGTDKLTPDYSIGNFAKSAFSAAKASIGSTMSSPADTPNPSTDLMSAASKGSGGADKGTEAIVSKGVEAGANSIAPGSGKVVADAAEKTGVTEQISHSFKP